MEGRAHRDEGRISHKSGDGDDAEMARTEDGPGS